MNGNEVYFVKNPKKVNQQKSDFHHKKYQNETFTMISGLLNNEKPHHKLPVS